MIELEVLKDYLNITTNATDTLLQQCIQDATGRIENYCNRKFIESETVEICSANSQDMQFARTIRIRNYPVNELIKVEAWTSNHFVEIDKNSIEVFGEVITVTNSGSSRFRITYSGGYSLTNMPVDLKWCAKILAAESYYESGRGEKRLGVAARNWNSQASEGASFKDVFEKVNKVLESYRVWNI